MNKRSFRIQVDKINNGWAASFEGDTATGFDGDSRISALIRLLESRPEYDFETQRLEIDYDRTNDDHLYCHVRGTKSQNCFKESLYKEHIEDALREVGICHGI